MIPLPPVVRYVPCRHGWHVYIEHHDPFPVALATTLAEARAAAEDYITTYLGYASIADMARDINIIDKVLDPK